MEERCVTALNSALTEAFETPRRRLPPRRGHARPVRRCVQGHPGPLDALARARDHDACVGGCDLRHRGRHGAARLAADPRDHVRRLHRARLRPDRERDLEVPRDVRRPGARAARRADADGRRRGYGPTHSQTLEKLLLGVPGITVVAPSECHDIRAAAARGGRRRRAGLLHREQADVRPPEPPPGERLGSASSRASRRRATTRRSRSPATASPGGERRSSRTAACCRSCSRPRSG